MAGAELYDACRALGGCSTGEVRLTSAFWMPADYIIHAVGPVWEGGDSGEVAAHIAVSTVAETLRECPGIEMVIFVTYDQDMEEFYLGELERL